MKNHFNFTDTTLFYRLIRGSRLVIFWFLLSAWLLISGCAIDVQQRKAPLPDAQTSFSLSFPQTGEKQLQFWYHSFNDPVLNRLIDQAVAGNLSLKQGYSRLKRAAAIFQKTSASKYPSLDVSIDGEVSKESGQDETSSWKAALGLSWEVDIWGRLRAAAKAAEFYQMAAREDLEGVALLLSTKIASTYFQLVERGQQLKLLESQKELNSTFLNLTKLRFANGAASVVDVYQQRQLMAAIRTQRLLILEQIVQLSNRMSVLLGKTPNSSHFHVNDRLPNLQQLPSLGIRADLLLNRPDLRGHQNRLDAEDHRLAETVAARLPQIKIGLEFGSDDGDVFRTFFGELFASIFDWGKRKSDVEQQRSVIQEQLDRYREAYMTAVEEVENGLWREHYHTDLVRALKDQLALSRANVRETRSRYTQGLTDYLPVLTAIKALQALESSILLRSRELIETRIYLCKALGGAPILGLNTTE